MPSSSPRPPSARHGRCHRMRARPLARRRSCCRRYSWARASTRSSSRSAISASSSPAGGRVGCDRRPQRTRRRALWPPRAATSRRNVRFRPIALAPQQRRAIFPAARIGKGAFQRRVAGGAARRELADRARREAAPRGVRERRVLGAARERGGAGSRHLLRLCRVHVAGARVRHGPPRGRAAMRPPLPPRVHREVDGQSETCPICRRGFRRDDLRPLDSAAAAEDALDQFWAPARRWMCGVSRRRRRRRGAGRGGGGDGGPSGGGGGRAASVR